MNQRQDWNAAPRWRKKLLSFEPVQAAVTWWNRHPKIAEFISYFMVGNIVTIIQFIMLPVLQAVLKNTSLVYTDLHPFWTHWGSDGYYYCHRGRGRCHRPQPLLCIQLYRRTGKYPGAKNAQRYNRRVFGPWGRGVFPCHVSHAYRSTDFDILYAAKHNLQIQGKFSMADFLVCNCNVYDYLGSQCPLWAVSAMAIWCHRRGVGRPAGVFAAVHYFLLGFLPHF